MMLCQSQHIALECAGNEYLKSVRTEIFRQDVEFQIGLEKMKISTSPAAWVNDWSADPAMELAALYKHIALHWNDTAQIGHIVKNLLDNRMRNVAEYIVKEQA